MHPRFHHCFGMVMGLACTSHVAAAVIPGPGFDPAATPAAVAAERCTSLYGVPTMFIAELALPDFGGHDLTSLRTGIMAGSPYPEAVMRQVVERMHMADVSICYGMTETSPVSLQTRTDGWMHTGDLAVMDEDGYVQITGRTEDLVIRGGEDIYPREVEELLHGHPDVLDVQVVGMPDERCGEELVAWVRLCDGAEPLTAQGVRAFCEGRLAHFEVPRFVEVVGSFRTTVTGRVREVEMRQIAAAELERG